MKILEDRSFRLCGTTYPWGHRRLRVEREINSAYFLSSQDMGEVGGGVLKIVVYPKSAKYEHYYFFCSKLDFLPIKIMAIFEKWRQFWGLEGAKVPHFFMFWKILRFWQFRPKSSELVKIVYFFSGAGKKNRFETC